MSTKIWLVELEGSDTVKCDELNLIYSKNKHGLIDQIARMMLDKGVSPEDSIKVVRKKRTIYPATNIMKWASRRLLENDNIGFINTKYKEKDLPWTKENESG